VKKYDFEEGRPSIDNASCLCYFIMGFFAYF